MGEGPLRIYSVIRDIVAETSAVVSWVNAVDELNREELTRSCLNWTTANSSILKEELTSQFFGKSSVGVLLDGHTKNMMLKSLSTLEQCTSPKLGAMMSGLVLIDGAGV